MKKLALIILDGWGKGDRSKSDAIAHAKTPFINQLYTQYPHSTLLTSGEDVGLPAGQMGNSEVGHLNIGAGRIVYQELQRINKSIEKKALNQNKVLLDTLNYCRENKKTLHLIGLVSDGGVHAHIDHLKAICSIAKENGLEKNQVAIHAFTDGRDTDPKSGWNYLNDLTTFLEQHVGFIATTIGRYYAMDRDKRWERVKTAYDLLTKNIGEKTMDVLASIKKSYENGITDEFIKPIVCTDISGNPLARIEEKDAVLCFNFRTDRCREITEVLTQQDKADYGMRKLDLYYTTMTVYDHTFTRTHAIFETENLTMTLGEILSKENKKQLRIAETEKYPHVTFFFSGGRENPFEGETRITVASPKVATYDLQPEMSALEITEKMIVELKKQSADFICLNFANADMVGHTGIYDAVVKAVETVDKCLEKVVNVGMQNGYSFIIIADHGNADYMINSDGSPNTAHSTNPVPCLLIDKDYKNIKPGILADVAPTILKILEISIPTEMKGKSLV